MQRTLQQLSLACALLGMSVLSWAQPVKVQSHAHIEEYRLDNGLRIILAPNAKEKTVFMNMIYFTGSLNDPQGKGGLAHLLEHLAFKGTQALPSAQFKQRLDQYTLSHNASTSYYSTQYSNILRAEPQALAEVLALEAQRMDQLLLPAQMVATEIDIVKREREVRLDQPFSVLLDQLLKSAYGNAHLGRLPIGDLDELASIKIAELEQFYRQWYAPNNAVLVLTGHFKTADALQQIEKHFASIAARKLPAQAVVPRLDVKALSMAAQNIDKGSHWITVNSYLQATDQELKTTLALIPWLYTSQPSGHLYQNLVQTKQANAVDASTWLDQSLQLVSVAAVYSPQHDATQLQQALTQGVEQFTAFDQTELQRVKKQFQNSQDSILKNATALGSVLSNYVVTEQGNWKQYFHDQDALNALTVTQVNQNLAKFLTEKHRVVSNIRPTKDTSAPSSMPVATTSMTSTVTAEETLSDTSHVNYSEDIAEYLEKSKSILQDTERKIQRGQLANGLQYALLPTTTPDDKIYARIAVNFADAERLFNQAEIIDLTAYLLLRGSEQYNLQQITDKAIEVNGSVQVSANGNGFTLSISAQREHFIDYLAEMLDVLRSPTFDQIEFDLAKQQTLAGLDRPYTEPDVVAGLTLMRTLERYPVGDLRYHFEPKHSQAQFQRATRAQVHALYEKFFAMNHAQVAVTGEFKVKDMQKILQKKLADWNTTEPYQRLTHHQQAYQAQKIHALAEAREFGSYQSILSFAVGEDHVDVPALQIFRHVLADSQLSSRLAQALREKNALVYSFNSHVNFNTWEDFGALSISANYSAGKGNEVSQLIHQVLQQMRTDGISAEELMQAKASLLKKRVSALDDPRRIHGYLIPQLRKNQNLLSRQSRDQAIEQLTLAQVNQAIKKHIQPAHWVEVMADQYGSVTQP